MNSEHARVTILDREFVIACGAGEKPALMKAARALDTKIRELHVQGPATRSFEQLIVVVALNLCNELSSKQAEVDNDAQPRGTSIPPETLERLIHKIDEAMN